MLFFAAVGISSSLKSKKTTQDYLLAGQDVKPWLAALSAVATNNSGYMFIGMIGYTYLVGLSSIWIMFGWIFGDYVMSLFVHKNLRHITQQRKALSFAHVLSSWHGTDYKKLRMLSGLITVIFLSVYAAAQLKAGSKALHVMLGWQYYVGAIMGAFIVLLYCFSGGIRASIWADAAQSFVMIGAMAILFFYAIGDAGGWSSFIDKMQHVSPNYLNILVSDYGSPYFATVLFIAGWLFAGFGVVGQPHIMIRFMTVDKPDNMKKATNYYYAWYVAFSILTIGVGLAARVIIPSAADFDAELALPTLSTQLLPEILVGLVLAGLFAATISTADSQILSCCASLTNDFTKKKAGYLVTKLGTLGVTSFALTIALVGSNSVFDLVVVSWSALASAFAPLLFTYALGKKVSENLAIAMMIAGLLALFLWRYFGLNALIYEAAPGVLMGLLVYYCSVLCVKLS